MDEFLVRHVAAYTWGWIKAAVKLGETVDDQDVEEIAKSFIDSEKHLYTKEG